MKVDKELLKGSTTMLILSLLKNEDMYGYKITAELKAHSDGTFDLKEGTLYPLLHFLENNNYIDAYWVDADSGRKRKYYKITEIGLQLLVDKKNEWSIYSNAVNKVIGGVCFE